MRFLADESCDFGVVRALRAAGHDVLAVKDVLPAAPDEQVADLAVRERRILLTEDKDFGRLVYAASGLSLGVIFIRFPAPSRSTLPTVVCDLVARRGTQLEGCFAVLKPGRVRLSVPPK